MMEGMMMPCSPVGGLQRKSGEEGIYAVSRKHRCRNDKQEIPCMQVFPEKEWGAGL
jgi:hypothetical protein